ncbi:MAG: RluA family pseudouridine synthase [Flavobacteriales bacterium]|jgi:23S rRNA pseudouridine1911/1915/1917 synthase|nr:RluA family pseudouridine synthase [Flavobacteriales bacterium]
MGENKEFEHYKFIADKGQNPLRVDRFLMNFVEFATRNKIQQSVKAGNVRVNDKVVKSNHKVKGGDVVTIVLDYPKETNELLPQDIPIIINYEDDDLLIVNKEAGMVVHPGFGNYDGTLVNALAFHFQNLPNMGEEERPGLVHRIDKNTSGILVVAKTERAMTILAKKFEDRDLNRKYIALVWGDVKEDEGTITGNIGRSLKNRKVMDVFPDREYGKHAVSHYKVLERFGYTTLVECKLETGRTHQIRAHFKSIGHILFNDEEYGGDAILKGTTFTKYKQFVQNCFKICPRQALHAKSLGFEHPTTKKEVFFDSDLADDMQELIEKWRKYATHQKL